MVLFFDTETTGLPMKGDKYDINYMTYPYIVQLSWKCSTDDEIKDFIIKPDGYIIPEESIKIHGITNEIANEKGINFNIVINKFIKDAYIAEKVIGHNVYFDTSIIKTNVLRHLRKIEYKYDGTRFYEMTEIALDKNKRVDTMLKSISFCNIPGKYGGCKWPKLEELYYKLFKESFPAHNSKEDVRATERCYYELIKKGIITS